MRVLEPMLQWGLPLPNNNFTGREETIRKIKKMFSKLDSSKLIIAACHGLAGIGKTEIARYFINHENYTRKIWFDASNVEQLIKDYIAFAKLAGVQIKPNDDHETIIDRVKNWLAVHPSWLIVYDNAENFNVLKRYIPHVGGHVLITSVNPSWPNPISIALPDDKEAEEFVNHVINRDEKIHSPIDILTLIHELDHLPLALAQASAYIVHHKKSISEYLACYRKNKLLMKEILPAGCNHLPVLISWNLSIESIKKESLIAYELLCYLCYLHPRKISRKDLIKFFSDEKDEKADQQLIDDALGIFKNYSILNFDDNSVTIHQLVQAAIYYWQLEKNEAQQILTKALIVLNRYRMPYLVFGGMANTPECLSLIINCYKEILKTDNKAMLWHSLGCCCLSTDYPYAKKCFEKSIELEASSPIYFEYGQALYRNGEIEEAVDYLEKCIACTDDYYSYFSEMEKSTTIPRIQEGIEEFGIINTQSRHLAFYLLIQTLLKFNDQGKYTNKILKYLGKFNTTMRGNKETFSNILLKESIESVFSSSLHPEPIETRAEQDDIEIFIHRHEKNIKRRNSHIDYIEEKPAKIFSQLDQKLEISEQEAIISLLRDAKGNDYEHCYIIVETIKNGKRNLSKYHLVENRNHYGYAKILIKQNQGVPGHDPEQIFRKYYVKYTPCYLSWKVSLKTAENLEMRVKKDAKKADKNNMKYFLYGHRSLFTHQTTPIFSCENEGHSCVSWARNILMALGEKQINHSLKIGVKDFLIERTSWLIPSKHFPESSIISQMLLAGFLIFFAAYFYNYLHKPLAAFVHQ